MKAGGADRGSRSSRSRSAQRSGLQRSSKSRSLSKKSRSRRGLRSQFERFSRGLKNVASDLNLAKKADFKSHISKAKLGSITGKMFKGKLGGLLQAGRKLGGLFRSAKGLRSIPAQIKSQLQGIGKSFKAGDILGGIQKAQGLAQKATKGFGALQQVTNMLSKGSKLGRTFGGLFGGASKGLGLVSGLLGKAAPIAGAVGGLINAFRGGSTRDKVSSVLNAATGLASFVPGLAPFAAAAKGIGGLLKGIL